MHSDLVDPISPIGYHGSRYILTLVGDCTRFLVLYAIKNQSEVVNCIKNYEGPVAARFSVKICKFRCDNR
jgi:hypothetical protein